MKKGNTRILITHFPPLSADEAGMRDSEWVMPHARKSPLIKGVRGLFLMLIPIFLFSCTANKYLKEGQYFYEGTNLTFKAKREMEKKAKVKTMLEELVRPEPNTKILGSRPSVWFYYLAGEPKKEKGLRHWIKTKLGTPPVLMETVDPDRTTDILESRLKNEGVFTANVTYEVKKKKYAKSIDYLIYLSRPYRYDTLHLPADSSAVSRMIDSLKIATLLKPGDRYDLQQMEAERLRLQKGLKDAGYYYFEGQYLLFRADSTVGNREVALYLKVKENTPDHALHPYTIGEVNVFTDYAFGEMDTTRQGGKTIRMDSMNYRYEVDRYRPKAITEHIRIQQGDRYNKEAEQVTINRMLQLDQFKFVNVDFEEMGDNQLKTNVFLTPFPNKSIQVELQAASKSDGNVGPNFNTTFRNRNAFRGAEVYELNLSGSYEWQLGGQQASGLSSYTIGVQNVLTILRIISPFHINYKSSRFVPQTKLKLGIQLLKRVKVLSFRSVNIAYGFRWSETATRRHEFYPADIDFIDLNVISQDFQDILDANPFLARSYQRQFVLGSSYSFFYNSQSKEGREERAHNFYFNGNLALSGNIAHVAQTVVGGEAGSEYHLLGYPYSQFAKVDVDIRHYWRLDAKNKLATRLIAGIGAAYGNSLVLPYSQQFTIGGPTSIRAFRARSLGPGVYEQAEASFFDQTGDIKLEANIEYRFAVIGALKGALFFDTGNIWTREIDDNRSGTQFDTDNFYKQLAMGTGAGLRYDAEFFVVRFDVGYPLKSPAGTFGGYQLQDMVYNIAIGYPF